MDYRPRRNLPVCAVSSVPAAGASALVAKTYAVEVDEMAFARRMVVGALRAVREVAVWIVAAGFVVAVALASRHYGLVDRTFWQQFVTTLLGVLIGAAAAVGLYYWKEARSAASRVADARQEARAWLLAIRDEVVRDQRLLDQIEEELRQGQTLFYRTYADVIEKGAIRLVELLKEHTVASELRGLFHEYDLMNRKLDEGFHTWSRAPVAMRNSILRDLQGSILSQVPHLRNATAAALQRIDGELARRDD